VTGHPSDFETLTLDLLIGPDGLEAIDAAVVTSEGPGYEPLPRSELKRDVVLDVLAALDVPLGGVDLEVEMSERYHEVGFLVRFNEPSLGVEVPLHVETADLQATATEVGLDRLKVSVCGVTDRALSPDHGMLSGLDVQANQVGRTAISLDRPACDVWTLTPNEQAASITITPHGLAATGFGVTGVAAAAVTALLVGSALLTVVARLRRLSNATRPT
jgi:hypothetical protein